MAEKRKILYKKVKDGRVTEVGLKSLPEGKTPFIPYAETHYKKGNYKLDFSPSEYNSSDGLERKKLAFQDAKQHLRFYQKLIRRGVYPKGTKVRVKYNKWGNGHFNLEFWMPKVKTLDTVKRTDPDFIDYSRQMNEISETIREEVAKVLRTSQSNLKYVPEGLDSDIEQPRNYGVDKEGMVRYIDLHITWNQLPFARRKNPFEKKNLEGKVGATTAIIGLLGSILFLSSNFTGNAIGNISRSSGNWIGVVLFLVGIAGGLLYFRRKFSKRTK
jgi:hypothetical protein